MIRQKIGVRIKELRLSKQYMNQEEFSKKIGCDKAYLSRVECGKQNITIDNLVGICYGLGITLSDFFSTFNTPIICEGEKYNAK